MDAAAWIAIPALLLSVLSLWVQHGRERRAEIGVTVIERHLALSGSSSPYIEIRNVGHAMARDVEVRFLAAGKEAPRAAEDGVLSVPRLAPAVPVLVATSFLYGVKELVPVEIHWNDKRHRRQVDRFTMSTNPTRTIGSESLGSVMRGAGF
jgi:hypothetical protein